MKYSISLALLLLVLSGFARAQNGIKLYGYVQAVSPGFAGRQRDENGKLVQKSSARVNYNIFLSSPSKSRIDPIEIWIKGKRYGVKSEAVDTTPVTVTLHEGRPDKGKVVLVPQTTARVFRLTGTPGPLFKDFPRAKKRALTHELVVVYQLNGKFYSATLAKFTGLESALLQ